MAVGPVDVYIIGFPGNKFSGQIAPAILELVENGTIRILDLLFVMKDADGVVTTLEAADLDEEGAAFVEIDVTRPGALGPDDAEEVSDDLPCKQLGPAYRIREPLGRESGRRSAGRGRGADRLDPDPGRRRRSVRGQLAPAPSRSRGNDMGLVRMAARTAVVAGTATAVSGRVQRRQAARYDEQDQQQYEQQQAQQPQYQQPPPAPQDDATAQLQNLAQLHKQGVLTDEEFAAAKAKILGI